MTMIIEYDRPDDKSTVRLYEVGNDNPIAEIEHGEKIVKKNGIIVTPDVSDHVDLAGVVAFERRRDQS